MCAKDTIVGPRPTTKLRIPSCLSTGATLYEYSIEANFERDGTEYRLGAERYTVDDYLNHISDAGFQRVEWREYAAVQRLVEEVPSAAKYVGRPLLLLVRAKRAV